MKRFTQHTLYYPLLFYSGAGTAFAEGPAEQEINRILGLFADIPPLIAVCIGIAATVTFLLFFWGLVDYIRKNEANTDAKKRMGWGIIGIFVLVSVWGLVSLLQTAILGTAGPSDPDIEFRKVESIAPAQ